MFFEIYLNKDIDLRMAWGTSKTFIRRYFIENNTELKKNQERTHTILDEIKRIKETCKKDKYISSN